MDFHKEDLFVYFHLYWSAKILQVFRPESVVKKEFHPKEGDWEGAEQHLNQHTAFA